MFELKCKNCKRKIEIIQEPTGLYDRPLIKISSQEILIETNFSNRSLRISCICDNEVKEEY